MKNPETVLYQLAPAGQYMMSYVLITREDTAIIIDGGRPEDMPNLKACVGGRHIAAWILTHAHSDHISGFVAEMERNGGADFDTETVYYHFPPYSLIDNRTVPDYEYFVQELNESLPGFNAVLPRFADKTHIVEQGEQLHVDEVTVDFLFSFHDGLYSNLMNDSSLVFRILTPHKTVLFLGDIGPDAGDLLFDESRDKLKADIVQMAHHGHMNCSMEVYAAILPHTCLWCTPEWVYEEPEVPVYLRDRKKLRQMGRIRMHGAAVTRRWMDQLGAAEHIVSKDGTRKIIL